MTYYGGKELAAAFREVRANTIQTAEDIPEDKYDYQAAPGVRSVAKMLVHIAVSPRFQSHLHAEQRLSTLEGFDFFGFLGAVLAEEQQPRTKAQILDLLKGEGEQFASWLETLTDDVLSEAVTQAAGRMPRTKSRFEMIMSAKEHEMHHRAQLMLIQRELNIVPHLTRRMNAMMEEMQKKQAAASASV
jgi:uncharacterized damage-inducible protein DinB